MQNSNRDISVDLLKFFAVILIINSHMDALYVKFSILATGGAIGDVLFLFVSGYTLFLGNMDLKFDNWYKRRVNRIFPTVLVCAIIASVINRTYRIPLEVAFGGQFVIAIMIYYVLLFFIRKYFFDKMFYCLFLVGVVSLLVYVFWYPYKAEVGEKGLYGITTLYRWIPYFGFMLFGSLICLYRKKIKYKLFQDIVLFLLSLVIFYSIQFASKNNAIIASCQILTLIPLMGIVYFFYKICNSFFFLKVYNTKYGHMIIMFVSSLCLESYLIQSSLFTTKMNQLFPFNLVIMIAIVLAVAYVCKCLSRIFIQTFSNNDYNWRKIVKWF